MANELKLGVVGAWLLVATGTVHGQWTVTNLHPDGAAWSEAVAVADGQQVGEARFGDTLAAIWAGDASSYLSIDPGLPLRHSRCQDVQDGIQVGSVGSSERQAAVWMGDAMSYVNLHPAGALRSEIFGIDQDQCVGFMDDGSFGSRAMLWNGFVDPPISLHPSGVSDSTAFGIHDDQQVGFVRFGAPDPDAPRHAVLWNSTAESYVELHPTGSYASAAYAIHNGQQVGDATDASDVFSFAALWTGTADSFVNLHPDGATYSIARDVYDGWQVGHARMPSDTRASIWHGEAVTWEDLHAVLPARFVNSTAEGVWHDGQTLYVVGYGRTADSIAEALMWTRPLIACPADFDGDGTLTIFDFLAFQNAFDAGDPRADFDGDGDLTIFDFLAFQNAFDAGCEG